MLTLCRKFFFLLVLLGIIIFAFWAFIYFHNPKKLPVTSVIIEGAPVGSQSTIQTIIQHELDKSLVVINLRQLQLALEKLPWVDYVELQRVWPNKLRVVLVPQEVLAYWNDKDFLNKNMEVIPEFIGMAIPENLPRLYGPAGRQVKVGYFYQKFTQIIAPLNLAIIQLDLANNGDISLMLDNGMKVRLGQQHLLTRLKRFVKVYAKVFGGQKDLSGDSVDLRYPSGMAVVWGSK